MKEELLHRQAVIEDLRVRIRSLENQLRSCGVDVAEESGITFFLQARSAYIILTVELATILL